VKRSAQQLALVRVRLLASWLRHLVLVQVTRLVLWLLRRPPLVLAKLWE